MDRFLIAAQEVGLETDLKPFLIPETAYPELGNVYIFRGRIRKRVGSRYMVPSAAVGDAQLASRLRVQVGTNGAPLSPVPGGGTNAAIGQMFSVGPDLFTVWQAAGDMLSTNVLATGTFDTAIGIFVINDPSQLAATPIFWYPALPVMGIDIYQTGFINSQPTIAFDTRFAYQYGTTGWQRISAEANVGAATWQGSDSQFFWMETFQGTNSSKQFLYVTNFNANEANFMRYYDGTQWHNYNPSFTDTTGTTISILTARMIIAFKGRLLLLNTVENNSTLGNGLSFVNRCRYSVIGSPIDNPGANYYAFFDDANSNLYKGAGFVDNTQTQEAIISAEFIKDRLIVYFERSVYELAYTGNEIFPFRWQQINTELGAQSTFSKVPFDKEVLAIGQTGIHSCSGANVDRIDNKIPDEVFDIQQQNNGVLRVQGIRDYWVEQVYWILPSIDQADTVSNTFPNRILVYNYKTQSWAYFSDSFTALGYYTQQPNLTWGTTTTTWGAASFTWGSGNSQSNFRQILAGNQEGYIVILDADVSRNAGALQITNITIPAANQVQLTIINHNITAYDSLTDSPMVIFIENVQGSGLMTALNDACFQISAIIDEDTIQITAFPMDPLADIYTGGGTVSRVSNINIVSKQWNPYGQKAQNFTINKMDFLVDRTGNGQVSVDAFNSTSYLSTNEQSVMGVNTGSFVLETTPYIIYPLENTQDQLWHTFYYNNVGTFIQIRLYMSDDQMINPNISLSPFVLHSLILYTNLAGRLQ